MSEIPRTCIACRTQNDKRNLIRVVRNSDGQVFIDPSHKANGRGAYLCNNKACITKALKSGVLARQLKVEIPQEIKDQLSKMVSQ